MNNSKLLLALPCIAALSLTGCFGGKEPTTSCPPPRYPDEKVGEELENIPYEGFEDLWAWIDQVEKLNEQLEVCR